jgi:hypothetical protein
MGFNLGLKGLMHNQATLYTKNNSNIPVPVMNSAVYHQSKTKEKIFLFYLSLELCMLFKQQNEVENI